LTAVRTSWSLNTLQEQTIIDPYLAAAFDTAGWVFRYRLHCVESKQNVL